MNDQSLSLPQPTTYAETLAASVSVGLAFIPGGGGFSRAVDFALERRRRTAEQIIVEELRAGNLNVIDDSRFSVFVPSALSIFQAADEGEYRHILRALAKIMIGDERAAHENSTRTLNAKRCLCGMSQESLRGLERFWVCYLLDSATVVMGSNSDGYLRSVTPSSLCGGFREGQYGEKLSESEDILSELVSRGLARMTVDVDHIGGVAYAPTRLASQVHAEVASVVEEVMS